MISHNLFLVVSLSHVDRDVLFFKYVDLGLPELLDIVFIEGAET